MPTVVITYASLIEVFYFEVATYSFQYSTLQLLSRERGKGEFAFLETMIIITYRILFGITNY